MRQRLHPLAYFILAVYAVIATTWAWTIGMRQTGFVRWLTIVAIIPVTIFIASFPGGMLWSWHDMQAGSVPTFWPRKLLLDGRMGLECGWLVIGLSFPYNFCGMLAGIFVTDMVEKRLHRTAA